MSVKTQNNMKNVMISRDDLKAVSHSDLGSFPDPKNDLIRASLIIPPCIALLRFREVAGTDSRCVGGGGGGAKESTRHRGR